jgi:predicted negative regulator of RcsB-dependent stress response
MKPKLKYLLLICALILTGCATRSSDRANPEMLAQEEFQRAVHYILENDPANAMISLERSAELNHKKAQALLAIMLIDKNDADASQLDAAYSWLQKSLAQNEPTATLGIYKYYKKTGDKKNAKLWQEKSISLDLTPAIWDKGQQLINSGNKKEGRAYILKAAKLNDYRAQVYLLTNAISESDHVNAYVWSSIILKKHRSLPAADRSKTNDLNKALGKVISEKDRIQAEKELNLFLAEMK